MPTTSRARDILAERRIPVVPDFIANAGGIVAAAHSMDMRYSPFIVNPDDIFTMISTKLRANAAAVLTEAKDTGQTPHTAARRLAQQRVRAAMRLRGKLPIDTVPEPLS
jgi:glutamate dehydrogenase (NAD(P)+)